MNATQPDLATILARIEALDAKVEQLVERQRKQSELFETFTPIAREALAVATDRLDVAEKKGYFAFARELFGVTERVVEGFSPQDVRLLGDAVVGILETVRAMTQPAVLELANETSAVLQHPDRVEPIGIVGMVRATRDENVQKGMALMMDVMRQVGRAAQLVQQARRASPAAQRRAKLAETLGPRRRAASGVERAAAARAPEAPVEPRLPACAIEAPRPGVAATVIDGIAFTADGHMVDASQWSEALALQLAAAQGVAMTEAHWAIVRFAREDFASATVAPNIRRITQGTGVTTKDLYALFPKAPARTVAKIAGIPKPAGCL